jgi:hypothetical protein
VQGDADRDRAIEHVLRQSRSAAGAEETAACIDAETLAAWTDEGLTPAQSLLVEEHLSTCARCTAMLATLVRTAPDVPATESFWSRWRLAWLVPIATAATAVAVWVATPRDNQQVVAPSVAQDSGASQARPSATTDARKEAQSAATESTLPERAPSLQPQFKQADESRQERERQLSTEPVAPSIAPASPEADRADLKAEQRAPQAAAPPPTSAPPAAAPAAAGAAARSPAPSPQTRNEAPAERDTRGFSAARQSAVTQIQVVSPDPAVRWRVIGAGQVERSTSSGAQWEPASMPESATLTHGTSPSPSVCWFAGRTGAVYLTTDGLRFMRVPFPERTDFVSIQASDGRRATVMTIDGRTFHTDDQGTTWTRVSP